MNAAIERGENVPVAPITVSQLIELLRQAPQEFTVIAQGCDCEEDAVGIVVNKGDKTVTVARDDNYMNRGNHVILPGEAIP